LTNFSLPWLISADHENTFSTPKGLLEFGPLLTARWWVPRHRCERREVWLSAS